MGINLERNKNSWSVSDVISLTQNSTAGQFATAMQNIDTKLNEIKKEITYWDIYKIASAITSAEDFENKVENLEINHSTVINTTHFKRSFQGMETDFYSGDIIVRLKDGSYQHIEAANAGVYIPTITDNNNGEETNENTTNLKITYNYATTVTNDQKEISATIKTLTGTNSQMYGYSIPGTYDSQTKKFSFDIVYQKKYDNGNLVNDTTKPIVPVLKFFDKNNQEVYTDEYTLRTNGSKYDFYLHNNASGIIKNVVIK